MSSAQDKDELWLDDDIIELDDDEAVVTKAINPWQVLIVDDEPDIHHATRLALSNIQYKSRRLNCSTPTAAPKRPACCWPTRASP